MKNRNLITVAFTILGAFSIFAQDIHPNNVPINLNQNFEQNYQ